MAAACSLVETAPSLTAALRGSPKPRKKPQKQLRGGEKSPQQVLSSCNLTSRCLSVYKNLSLSFQGVFLTTRCHCFLFLPSHLTLSAVLLSSPTLSKGKMIRSHKREYFVYLFLLTICCLYARFEKPAVFWLSVVIYWRYSLKCFTAHHFTFEFSFSSQLMLTLGALNKKNVLDVRLI